MVLQTLIRRYMALIFLLFLHLDAPTKLFALLELQLTALSEYTLMSIILSLVAGWQTSASYTIYLEVMLLSAGEFILKTCSPLSVVSNLYTCSD